jgi:ribonuclease III
VPAVPVTLPSLDEYAELEGFLGHSFAARELLVTALTHKSFLNEYAASGAPSKEGTPGPGPKLRDHNERLEFLGDSVLGLIVTHLLMEACPDFSEGALSLLRSKIISEASLAEKARAIELGRFLLLGRGEEQSGGRQKPSLLADAYEAVFGALYLDSGFAVCMAVARRLLTDAIASVQGGGAPDQKSALQEHLQRVKKSRPRYEVIGTSGPDHDKTFEVAVYLDELRLATATGRSKRAAEQAAAEQALHILLGQ